jgi:hypothetical protein
MTATEILQAIQHHPGAMMRVVIESPVPTLKSVTGATVVKRSELFVTAGTEFANRKDVREAIEAGERGTVGPLPWGVWAQYPFIIAHKGNEYIRLYPPSEAQLQHFNLTPKAEFFSNGSPITREQAIELCGSKAKSDDSKHDAFAVNAANIVSIG